MVDDKGCSSIEEAKGTYKNKTVYIWQVKNKKHRRYSDNITNKDLGTDLAGLKKHVAARNTDNLDTRIIKRTVKEDLI